MLSETQPTCRREDRNEQMLVEAVQAEVQHRLNQFLYSAVLRAVGKGDQPIPLARPWRGQLDRGDGASQAVGTETSMASIFNHPSVNGRLLIAGPWGSGKTTTLLELAAELIQRVQGDSDHPIPVLFHLASWPVEQQTFADWLRAELKLKYGVSQELSTRWLQADILLPMLDGLGELTPHRQAAVLQHLNQWLRDKSGPLVVCYHHDNPGQKPISLAMGGTLALAPLAPEQLEQYLIALELKDLWTGMQPSPELLELARSPLGLSLLILTSDAFDFAVWERLNTPQEQQNYVIDRFILQQLHQPIGQQEFAVENRLTAQQTRHWLSWLARHMQDQAEQEFLIEKMQPSLLSHRRQIILYSLLGGIIFGSMGGAIFGLFVGPFSGVFVGFITCLMFVARRGDDRIAILEEVKPTFSSLMQFVFVRQIGPLLLFLSLLGLFAAVRLQDLSSLFFMLIIGLILGLAVRLIIALPSWLMGGLAVAINQLFEADMIKQTQPNYLLFETARYSLRVVALFIPVLVVVKLLPLYSAGFFVGQNFWDGAVLANLLGVGAAIALWAILFDSALVCAQHLALRLVLFRAKVIPWNYARFLNSCCDRHLLQRVGGRYQFIHPLVHRQLL